MRDKLAIGIPGAVGKATGVAGTAVDVQGRVNDAKQVSQQGGQTAYNVGGAVSTVADTAKDVQELLQKIMNNPLTKRVAGVVQKILPYLKFAAGMSPIGLAIKVWEAYKVAPVAFRIIDKVMAKQPISQKDYNDLYAASDTLSAIMDIKKLGQSALALIPKAQQQAKAFNELQMVKTADDINVEEIDKMFEMYNKIKIIANELEISGFVKEASVIDNRFLI